MRINKGGREKVCERLTNRQRRERSNREREVEVEERKRYCAISQEETASIERYYQTYARLQCLISFADAV